MESVLTYTNLFAIMRIQIRKRANKGVKMMDNNLTFGKFITQKRKELSISLRSFAFGVDLSPVYICDIEKDRRPAPAQHILDKMFALLHLDEADKLVMYDLAGESRNAVPIDLPKYIMEKDIVKTALRKAKEVDATDAEWEEFINRITNRNE